MKTIFWEMTVDADSTCIKTTICRYGVTPAFLKANVYSQDEMRSHRLLSVCSKSELMQYENCTVTWINWPSRWECLVGKIQYEHCAAFQPGFSESADHPKRFLIHPWSFVPGSFVGNSMIHSCGVYTVRNYSLKTRCLKLMVRCVGLGVSKWNLAFTL